MRFNLKFFGVTTFLLDLKQILERILTSTGTVKASIPPPQFYTNILHEIDSMWQNLVYVNTELNVIHVKVYDAKDREHIVEISLGNGYPKSAPVCKCHTPAEFHLNWNETYCLREVITQFKAHLSEFQELWDLLDDIDSNTCVLDPKKSLKGSDFKTNCNWEICLNSN